MENALMEASTVTITCPHYSLEIIDFKHHVKPMNVVNISSFNFYSKNKDG